MKKLNGRHSIPKPNLKRRFSAQERLPWPVITWEMTGEWQERLLSKGKEEGRTEEYRFFVDNLHRFLEYGIAFIGTRHGLYPWRYCDPNITIPIEFVQRMLVAEFDVDVKKKEITDLINREFLPKSGGEGLPLFAKDRIMWMRECRKKFGYTDSQVRQLVEYEDQLMKHLSASAISYADCKFLNIGAGRSRSKRPKLARTSHSRNGKRSPVKQLALVEAILRKLSSYSELEYISKTVHWFDKHKPVDEFPKLEKEYGSLSGSLSGGEKELYSKLLEEFEEFVYSLTELAEGVLLELELGRRVVQAEHSAQSLLGGFSPQIEFSPAAERPRDRGPIEMASIDWTQSLKNVDDLDLDFVRTPMFTVEHDNGAIDIRIMKPNEITTKEISEIVRPAYSKIRDKVVTGRRPHGALTGSRDYYKKRNERLAKQFRENIRPTAPSAEEAYKRLQQWMKDTEKLVLSVDHLRKIIREEKG